MKTLYIVRHAKASLKRPEIVDLDRPLLEKGKKRTKKIIDYLLLRRIKPDIILTSNAKRATDTAKYIARGLSCSESRIRVLSYFYRIDTSGIINEFMDFSDEHKSVMIVGHNPAITNFVNRFTKNKVDSLPTSSVVCIKFKTSRWDEIESCKSSIEFIITPSMLNKS
jgi:phosphohistidine phosphatase